MSGDVALHAGQCGLQGLDAGVRRRQHRLGLFDEGGLFRGQSGADVGRPLLVDHLAGRRDSRRGRGGVEQPTIGFVGGIDHVDGVGVADFAEAAQGHHAIAVDGFQTSMGLAQAGQGVHGEEEDEDERHGEAGQ